MLYLSFLLHTLVLSVAVSIAVVIIDLTVYKDYSLKATTNANRIVWITDVGIVSVVVIIGAYTGVKRMRYMIDTIVELKQVILMFVLVLTFFSVEVLKIKFCFSVIICHHYRKGRMLNRTVLDKPFGIRVRNFLLRTWF